MNAGWSIFVVALTVLNLSGVAWLLWWTLGTAACGVALLVLGLFGPAPRLVVGFPTVVLLFAGNVMLWHSLRLFNGRAASIAGVVLIVLAFAALLATSIALGASLRERAGIASAGLAIFAALSAWEVSRDRDREFLRTRLAMAAAFGVMALVLVLRGALTWLAPESAEAGDYYDPLQGASSLINSISVVSLSIGLIMMANERTSGRHRRLALTDELTGLPNRRFFLAQAARLAQRAARRRAPRASANGWPASRPWWVRCCPPPGWKTPCRRSHRRSRVGSSTPPTSATRTRESFSRRRRTCRLGMTRPDGPGTCRRPKARAWC